MSSRASSRRSRAGAPGRPRVAARKTYSSHTTSVYEIIGAYFVDVVYNHLYKSAVTRANQGGTVTEQYQLALQAYLQGVTKDKKVYNGTVHGVLNTFQTSTQFGSIGVSQFIEEIMVASLPTEIHQKLHDRERNQFLSVILKKTVAEVVTIAAQPDMLRAIIDDHFNPGNVLALQDELLTAMLGIHDEIFHSFLHQITGKKKGSHDAELVKQLRDELRAVAKERDEYAEALKVMKRRCAEAARAAAADRGRAEKSEQLVGLLVGRVKALAGGGLVAAAAPPVVARAPAVASAAPVTPAVSAAPALDLAGDGSADGTSGTGSTNGAAGNNPFAGEPDSATDGEEESDNDDDDESGDDSGDDSGDIGDDGSGSGDDASDMSDFDIMAVVED